MRRAGERGRGALVTLLLAALPLAGARAAEVDLTAPLVPVSAAPVVDGRADRVWEQAPAVRVTLGEGTQGSVEVTVRALRTATHLHLLVRWPDRTESLRRGLELVDRGWRPTRGGEDRLNIGWDIGGSVKGFALGGCQLLCHKTEGMMRTGGAGERLDLWYWMAQRTNPLGVADDWVMGHEPGVVGGWPSGRRPDAPGGGPWEPNWDDAGRRPRWMPRPGLRPGPVLLRKDAAAVTDAARFTASARLPREVLAPPAGPRAGIEARGIWMGGHWTVELGRRLTTDDEADVQFSGPGPFLFAISIHDDAEKDEHAHMGRDVLRLHLR